MLMQAGAALLGHRSWGCCPWAPAVVVGDAHSPALTPATAHTSASDPKQAQEQRARGYHHFSVTPCKLTRCLAALPAHVPASPLPSSSSSTASVFNARASSPAASAPHLLGCVSAQGLPTAPAQPALATISGWPDTSCSQHIPTEKPQLQPFPTGAGWHSPCQATPQGPVKAMGG